MSYEHQAYPKVLYRMSDPNGSLESVLVEDPVAHGDLGDGWFESPDEAKTGAQKDAAPPKGKKAKD